jgi:uncharacterized 2Fe-2S/4Fe-4S cluster protein (DUF4445 family)
MAEIFEIDFEPLGRRGKGSSELTLLDVAQSAGVGLASVCGGAGTCEECRVRIIYGRLNPPTILDQSVFSPLELSEGYRLACQATPLSDCKIVIPAESLTAAQRLQLDGNEKELSINPAVKTPGAYGLAVDIGTTKLAAFLVDLQTGKTLSRVGAMNPQIAFGEDVISRIAYAGRNSDGAEKLQSILVKSINELIEKSCAEAQISPDMVVDAVFVGNTAMHHLFAGLPVDQLGRAPFSPATTQALYIPAKELGLKLGAGSSVYLPPVIAGYVGADHVSMLIASSVMGMPGNVIALDIGTNTEISLLTRGKISCCSCASGPAFEGAHIQEGMRAAPGAVERARWTDGKIEWQTIDNQPPVGICGSGILDVVAAFVDGNLVKQTGALKVGTPDGYELVPPEKTGYGKGLFVTRKDIHEIQLAKSAIRAGIDTLLQESGLQSSDLDSMIVAGAFGTYLDLRSAVRIGMFPDLPINKFNQIGNAAGVGAKEMLVSIDKRRDAENLAARINYIELTSQPTFTSLFLQNLSFELKI